jgi:hypothetical protein
MAKLKTILGGEPDLAELAAHKSAELAAAVAKMDELVKQHIKIDKAAHTDVVGSAKIIAAKKAQEDLILRLRDESGKLKEKIRDLKPQPELELTRGERMIKEAIEGSALKKVRYNGDIAIMRQTAGKAMKDLIIEIKLHGESKERMLKHRDLSLKIAVLDNIHTGWGHRECTPFSKQEFTDMKAQLKL